MVSTTVKENGVNSEEVSGLPPGDYSVVGLDLDTTGRRLIDEICHIAAFSPADSFSQYVMPFRDLNFLAQRRHSIKVITVGRYRMLKDSKTGKVSCTDLFTAPAGGSFIVCHMSFLPLTVLFFVMMYVCNNLIASVSVE